MKLTDLTDEELRSIDANLQPPEPNMFISDNLTPISKKVKSKNRPPKRIASYENDTVVLYHAIDHVHRKCTTHIDIVLRINQLKGTTDSNSCFLETPEDFACLNVFYDALEATIIEMFGYDASLCGIDFEF